MFVVSVGNRRYCSVSCRSGESYHRNQRARRLERVYGLTVANRDAMFAKQGGRCALCRELPDEEHHPELVVDHDHATGEVRGLLHARCNALLGMARDDPSTLRAAARYLELAA